VLKRRLTIFLICAAIVSGCAGGRAYRKGQEVARLGDWDAAVKYFTEAVQDNPNKPEYKIALERAQQSASLEHISRARELEQKDQLDAALLEYRKALETDASNRLAASKAAELEKTIRDRIEASRPKPRIDTLREQARQQRPLLDPSSRDPIKVTFNNASLRDILRTIGDMTGINVTFDQQFQDRAYTVTLDGVTLEQSLQQIMTANQKFYKVHVEAQELSQMVSTIMRVPQMAVQPTLMANKTANTITVRATAAVVDIIERIIRANDKPRAEVLIGESQSSEAVRAQPERLCGRRDLLAGGGAAEYECAADRSAAVAAAVQLEYDLAGDQHCGFLPERTDRAGALPRE
jgi:hypothetical protein